jgi:putative transposase
MRSTLIGDTWLDKLKVNTLFIEPGSPWENGYNESFNGKPRNELLNGELFYTIKEAQILIEQWRCHYNRVRPRSALGYRPPAPETVQGSPRFSVASPSENLAVH